MATGVASYFMWNAAKVPAGVPNSPDLAVREAQLRVDVIRNILAVGAGTGGLIALFLALRRQYVKERVDHADQEHKNRTAEDAKHDASEKRVTELYVKAAEQLGSEKAPVRMAALYALERLGQGNPEHRQTVMNLICAYLRMPIGDPSNIQRLVAGEPTLIDYTQDSDTVEELEVRKAAQDLIGDHLWGMFLSDGRVAHDNSYWGSLDLNLRGAVLINWKLSSCKVGSLNIEGACFIGDADFADSMFTGGVAATGAVFLGSLDFSNVKDDGLINFRQARFMEAANFSRTPFSRLGIFMQAMFDGHAVFDRRNNEKLLLSDSVANLNPRVAHSWPEGYLVVPTTKDGIGVVKAFVEESDLGGGGSASSDDADSV
ncbi:pentapeptide repeat-containing protein [Verrucosispora sp. ts21]|uniref:pentapeptide repeat-containing protein n=1 Tax=Verrucosispora sp. ts21 TaxID=2069341 RepID=UPI0011AF4CFD|nr:pentapeptide repeat-containing protein [Verrucosispora sp. ts21]